jgi:hypothetical protein
MAGAHYLEALTTFYSDLAIDSMALVRSMREDLQSGNFEFTQWTGRSLSLMFDACEGWYGAVLSGASAPVPTVLLEATPAGDCNAETVRIVVGENPKLQHTDLMQLGGSGCIKAAHLHVEPAERGIAVDLRIKGLPEDDPEKTLQPGLYQGLVYSGSKPLMIVLLRVEG